MASKRLIVEIWTWKAQKEVKDMFLGPREEVSLLCRDRRFVLGSSVESRACRTNWVM